MVKNKNDNLVKSVDKAEGMRAFASAIGVGLKFAAAIFLSTLIFLPDRVGTYPGADITLRPDRAAFWSVIALITVTASIFFMKFSGLVEKSRVKAEVEQYRSHVAQPIATNLRLGLHSSAEQAYFEIPKVARYEIRRTRAANFAIGSIGGKVGPIRIRAGNLFFDTPDVWREIDRGTLVATSTRLIFQGVTRRQEWKWHLVGDIVFDQHGLLVWPRSGKPIGLKCGPQPKLFAFIENQLSN